MICFAFIGAVFMTDTDGGTAVRLTDATEFTTQLLEPGKRMVYRSAVASDYTTFTLTPDQIGVPVANLMLECAGQANIVRKPLDTRAVGG